MAKGLQIRLIKEELRASPVRDDMVHIRRFRQLPLLKALLTVGVLKDEALPKRLPSAAVSALCRGSAHLATTCVTRRLRFGFDFGVALGASLRMGVAVTFASRHGFVTAWIGAKSEKRHGRKRRKGGDLGDPGELGGLRPELRVDKNMAKKTTLR